MSEPTCLDLRELFGDKYRIGWEADSTHRSPWEMQLLCKYGLIYPWGGTRLAVQIDFHPNIARQVARLPGVELVQDGDDEKTFRFDVSSFDAVAELVKPRRKRVFTDEQKAELVERLRGGAAVSEIPPEIGGAEAPFSA